jgi:FtsH-binding integral membrane protein
MSYAYQPDYPAPVAANLAVQARAQFIMRTYGHLLAAVLGFTALEVYLFTSGLALPIARAMLSTSWLIVLGAFVLAGWLFRSLAHSARSRSTQYIGLAAFVAVEAIIFVPLLLAAQTVAPGAIQSAALTTIMGFIGLTAVAFTTRKDFSFLGSILRWGGVMALVLIVAGAIFGFQLGTFFSVAMVGLAGASILYDTSNVLHHYPEDSHVAAALELFSAVALMFWYVLQLFMATSRRD